MKRALAILTVAVCIAAGSAQANTQKHSAWPTHHTLWYCIAGEESGHNPQSINPNGHYGLLQMHPNWGYGTSYYASNDSALVQEWAAELAYKASGYSYSFLYGQWFEWDSADYCAKYR